MPKKPTPDTAQNTFCDLQHTMETLYWSMRITPDNVQALIKVQMLRQQAEKLENQIQTEIEKQDDEEI